LAAAGTAFAQSSVSIYGQFDAGVYSVKNYTAGKNATVFGDGAIFSNVIGFRGSEDLGGGMRANFQLETDVQTNNGGINQNGLFRRQANVGFVGGFGEIKVGTTLNPIIATNGALMPVGGNSVMTNVASALGYADFFTRNAVTYNAPAIIKGLAAQAQYGYANSVNEISGGSVLAGSLAYTSGPLQLRAAMQKRDGINGTSAATGNASAANPSSATNTSATSGWPTVSNDPTVGVANKSLDKSSYVLGARYEMGALSLGAAYMSNEFNVPGAAKTKVTGTVLGAGYVMGANTFGLNYASAEKSTLTSFQVRHALSKRTNIIAIAGLANNDSTIGFAPVAFNTGSGTATITDSTLGSLSNRGTGRNISGFGLGLTHSF
jgi:predicted porin